MSFFNKLLASSLPYVPKPAVDLVARRYIAGENLDSSLSLKLTQLGLREEKEFCEENLREILSLARERKIFVQIDMEDHTCTEATLEIYYSLRKDYDNVGVVIQAYLRRSESDVRELLKQRANIRLVKGIYIEPRSIAFKRREVIRTNTLHLLGIMLAGGCYVGIATHDEVLIDGANRLISEFKLSRDQDEFQTLLGVRANLRLNLVRAGHRVCVYIPYGEDWYSYSIRRSKENPQIPGYVFKAFFTRDTVR